MFDQRWGGNEPALAAAVQVVPVLLSQLHGLQQDGGDEGRHSIRHVQSKIVWKNTAAIEGKIRSIHIY
jgi:hypothetical protein